MNTYREYLCGIDVWRGVWRCMHAKLAPLAPHPLPGIAILSLHYGKGNALGQATFLPHFSSATQVCGWCDYTLPSFRDLRISGLGGELAAGCLWSRPAWIVFCFRCWVTDAKGKVRHWVLGGGGYGMPLSLLRYLHLAAHCQSDKSGHVVASFCTFQHNRYQTIRRKRRFAHLF